MAQVTQTITITPEAPTPFSGVPGVSDPNNVFPRARITFKDKTTITSKGAGDTKTVRYNMDLPANFAYRLDQAVVLIGDTSSTDADNYDNLGFVNILLDSPFSSIDMGMQLLSQGNTPFSAGVAGTGKYWNILDKWGELFYSPTGSAVRVSAFVNDTDGVNASAALSDGLVFFSFLQYDIEQANYVVANAPTPVNVV